MFVLYTSTPHCCMSYIHKPALHTHMLYTHTLTLHTHTHSTHTHSLTLHTCPPSTQIPRFAFEKFPGAKPFLTTQMKSVGEAMAFGRTFQVGMRCMCGCVYVCSVWGCVVCVGVYIVHSIQQYMHTANGIKAAVVACMHSHPYTPIHTHTHTYTPMQHPCNTHTHHTHPYTPIHTPVPPHPHPRNPSKKQCAV